ncbi:MAG TPA: NADH-quinone oxidoreductase subunit C [Gaiellaceae bacterium]|jgi:Ni,Fe-hydrogenase III large subunit
MTAGSTIPAGEAHEFLDGRFRAVREPAPPGEQRLLLPIGVVDRAAALLLERRARFVAMFLRPERSLAVAFAVRGQLVALQASVDRTSSFPSLALLSPAFRLPERELHDLHGIVPLGHPDLASVLDPDPDHLRRRVEGEGTFLIPYGPIRSGVFESIQHVIETGGEDVLALGVRPYFKRRGLESRFDGLTPGDGATVAERVAGIASVAHACAFTHAVERALGVEPSPRAQLWRVVHAELERIANHLDVATRLAEDAGLSVGVARFGILKEQVMRLRARLCGSRFGRGVVVPGGISAEPLLSTTEIRSILNELERDLRRDRKLLLRTPSFTDRLIGSGTLEPITVDAYAGIGPVARGSGIPTDARFERPYGAYRRLGFRIATAEDGDAMARLEVRFDEIRESIHLIRQALERDAKEEDEPAAELPAATGAAFGWAEAPMGELVYWVEVAEGRLQTVRISSPSLRNWPVFAAAFRGDVLTDFSFIEHSFGLTPAGADR